MILKTNGTRPYEYIGLLAQPNLETLAADGDDKARQFRLTCSSPQTNKKGFQVSQEALRNAAEGYLAKGGLVTYNHALGEPIGNANAVIDQGDTTGIEGTIMHSVQLADDTWQRMIQKVINAGSIGFDTPSKNSWLANKDDENAIPLLIELDWWETAVCSVPSDPGARGAEILGFAKSIGLDGMELYVPEGALAVLSFQDLPLAPVEYEWDERAAEKRVREWAGDDNDKYRRAFLWQDRESPEEVRLGYADIIDGELQAVWRAVASVTAGLAGGRGGADIPEADKQRAVDQVARYYAKFNKPLPLGLTPDAGLTTVQWLADEKTIFEEQDFASRMRNLSTTITGAENIVSHWQKDGRVLSPTNQTLVETARDDLTALLEVNPGEPKEPVAAGGGPSALYVPRPPKPVFAPRPT